MKESFAPDEGSITGPMNGLDVNGNNSSSSSNITLVRVYPNPLNDHATIQFTIPSDGEASIEIVNMLGAMVKDVEARLITKKGTYEIALEGQQPSPGIYSCVLKLANKVETSLFVISR